MNVFFLYSKSWNNKLEALNFLLELYVIKWTVCNALFLKIYTYPCTYTQVIYIDDCLLKLIYIHIYIFFQCDTDIPISTCDTQKIVESLVIYNDYNKRVYIYIIITVKKKLYR